MTAGRMTESSSAFLASRRSSSHATSAVRSRLWATLSFISREENGYGFSTGKADSYSVTFVTDLQKRRDQLFSPQLCPTIAAVEAKWREVEQEQIAFVEGVTDEGLNRMLPFRTIHVSLAHLMQHVANHSTYHRGQIALMMRQLNAEPIATDFHVFLVEGRMRR